VIGWLSDWLIASVTHWLIGRNFERAETDDRGDELPVV